MGLLCCDNLLSFIVDAVVILVMLFAATCCLLVCLVCFACLCCCFVCLLNAGLLCFSYLGFGVGGCLFLFVWLLGC